MVDYEYVDPFGVDAAEIYEKALVKAKHKGIKVKILLICNPHYQLGACFSKDALLAIVKFAVKHNINLVSD
jgi:1-aminocyclopropane-1-carboxylate synthase